MPEGSPVRLFISYSHKDQNLREALADHLASLQREGVIDVWHDRQISAGEDWAEAIDTNLEAAEIVLCLVSAGFLASPYCNGIELKRALERHAAGKARVIPVILKPADWSSTPLGGLQALPPEGKAVTKWTNRDEAFLSIAQGIRMVAKQLNPPADPKPNPTRLPEITPTPDPLIPVCLVQPDSAFYIAPPEEARCCAELDKPGALIRVKGPKGFGKLSFTARLLAYAKSKGYRTASLNLIGTDQKFFSEPELFMQWFCASVGKELGLRVRKEDYWDDIFGANDNSSDYFETYLLKPDPTPLVLAIDNFDRIFAHASIETDFCGLLRSWHERARSSPLWERFRLVLSHSQEPYLEKDINQSPFNVGLPVELGELEPAQVRHLVTLHGLQLSEAQVEQLLDLVGGHPYLVRKALYELATGLSFPSFLEEAPTDAGIYGDHLRSLLKAVEDHPKLAEALRQVFSSTEPIKLRSQEAFKLESLGVLVPEGSLERERCSLYRRYFQQQWGTQP